jgi:hypothetical protein
MCKSTLTSIFSIYSYQIAIKNWKRTTVCAQISEVHVFWDKTLCCLVGGSRPSKKSCALENSETTNQTTQGCTAQDLISEEQLYEGRKYYII